MFTLKRAQLAALVLAGAGVGAGAARYYYAVPYRPGEGASAPVAPAPAGELHFANDAPQWTSIKVAALAALPMPVAEPVNGRISYDESRTARISSPLAGRVTALPLDSGAAVAAGAVLASIDAPELATAQADWRKAAADETRKRLAFERADALYRGEVLPRKDMEAAQSELAQAGAETRRASQRLRSLHASEADEGNFRLRAPLAGVLAERQINPGQEVRPDLPAPLFVVSDLHRLWVLVDLPERLAGAIRPGQAVSVEADAYPGERFAASVLQVGQSLDPQTHRMQVRCAVANPALRLKPEMFARVAFLAGDGSRPALRLPNTSLFTEGMYEYVFVETRRGHFSKRRVTVALRGADSSYIGAGLADGERVVTEGAFLLNAEVAAHAQ